MWESEHDNPEDALIERIGTRQEFLRALSLVTPLQREILVMHAHGYTMERIARTLSLKGGVPASGSGMAYHFHRAIKHIRAHHGLGPA